MQDKSNRICRYEGCGKPCRVYERNSHGKRITCHAFECQDHYNARLRKNRALYAERHPDWLPNKRKRQRSCPIRKAKRNEKRRAQRAEPGAVYPDLIRRHLLHSTSDGSVNERSRREMLARATHCPYCLDPFERSGKTTDHKIPVSRGGRNTIKNIEVICARCNGQKASMTPDEFRAKLARLAAALQTRAS